MKRLWIGIGILMLGLTGCQKEYANETEHIFVLLEKDKPNNRKSVYWDGVEAKLMKDGLDDENICDGRWGPYCLSEKKVEDTYSFAYFEEYFYKSEIISESASDYHIVTEDMDYHIEQVDYADEKKAFSEGTNFKEIEPWMVGRWMKENAEKYIAYKGIEEFEERLPYAGYVLLFQSKETGNAYKISVTGLGYLEDISIIANRIMSTFQEIEPEKNGKIGTEADRPKVRLDGGTTRIEDPDMRLTALFEMNDQI